MKDILLCHPRLQVLAGRMVKGCGEKGLQIKIGETLRTVKEQDELYAQGRTKPGNIVTNAPGSSFSSYHQWGTAFDIYRNDGAGAYNETGNFFGRAGAVGASLGLEWGGNWKSIVDKPHFQLPDWGSSTSGIKKLYKNPQEFMKTWAAEGRTGWLRDNNGWWYRRTDSTYPVNKWCVISHHWYLFNQDGYMCTSWHRWDGKACDPQDGTGDWFYFDSARDGALEGACWHTREDGAQEIWYVDRADEI